MEVYLIRHTAPDIEKGICYGQSDIPLAQSFENEWNAVKKKLPVRVDKLFTSPLSPCIELSKRLSSHYEMESVSDNRLMEINFGSWEMKKWDDIDQNDLTIWMNDYLTQTCPLGESYNDVKHRLKHFILENLLDDLTYLIITHGGIIKCFHGLVNNTHGMDLAIGYGESFHFKGTVPAYSDESLPPFRSKVYHLFRVKVYQCLHTYITKGTLHNFNISDLIVFFSMTSLKAPLYERMLSICLESPRPS
jgi:alpha-ribazole phosphatase